MKIKDYKCKCGHDDFFFAENGNNMGIYCSYCGKWKKWADKDERNLSVKQEQKTGKWIYGENEYGIDGYYCDKCGFFVPWDYVHKFINYIEDYNFCPNCGARMEC